MKKLFLIIIGLAAYHATFAQIIGNGDAQKINTNNSFNTPLLSGFYTTANTQAGYPSGFGDNYRFLINLRSINAGECCGQHQFQISSSCSVDDRVFFRKQIKLGVNNVWHEIATRGANIFNGDQKINGKVYANEVRVETTRWADFVFDADYKLPALSEVKAHIEEHRHLPGIPSEAEVRENGIGLAETTTLLLQKVEELILYAIQQNEEIQRLKEENQEFKKLLNK